VTEEPPGVALADRVAALMYGLAGWLLIGLGTLAALSGAGGIVGAGGPREALVPLVALGIGLAVALAGAVVNPRTRRRLARRREPTRFGRDRTVETGTFAATDGRPPPCVACGTPATEGMVRRYREEVLVAGVPVWTTTADENRYCPACGRAELGVTDEAATTDRAPESLVERE
jgi:hypothetical protein